MHLRTFALAVVVPCLLSFGCSSGEPAAPEDDVAGSAAALTADATESVEVTATIIDVVARTVASSMGEHEASQTDDGPRQPGPDEGGPPRCDHAAWNPLQPLRVVITYDACPLPAGGTIDGTLAVEVEPHEGTPSTLRFEATDLVVDAWTIDGELEMASDAAGTLRFESTLDLESATESLSLSLVGATLERRPDGSRVLDGEGFFGKGASSYAIDARAVEWKEVDPCGPSSGSMRLRVAGQPDVAVTFDSDPIGAFASIAIAGLPPVIQRPTCER